MSLRKVYKNLSATRKIIMNPFHASQLVEGKVPLDKYNDSISSHIDEINSETYNFDILNISHMEIVSVGSSTDVIVPVDCYTMGDNLVKFVVFIALETVEENHGIEVYSGFTDEGLYSLSLGECLVIPSFTPYSIIGSDEVEQKYLKVEVSGPRFK
jgi:hypothetical protein